MSDFSIELAAERIQNHNTREYFGEVYQDYMAGSYRSATVMLWSVVVCDLLFKLQEMRDVYSDAVAGSILRDIEERRVENPSSPEWESVLLDLASARTSLLETGDYESLRDLRAHRHLSAHPVLDQIDALYSPTREQVRAYMRTALESVLTKPALLTRKVLGAFTDDVCARAPELPDEDSLHRYLEAKYFGHLTPVVLGQLFKGVWHITFHSEDTGGEENRHSLLRALCQLYGAAPEACDLALHQDASYFSEVGKSDDQLNLLSSFLSEHPTAYARLTDQAKAPLQGFLGLNLDAFSVAWYVDDSVQAHVQALVERATAGEQRLSLALFRKVYSIAVDHDCADQIHDLGIRYYGESGTYDRANAVYYQAVRPYLDDYTIDTFRRLLAAVETNNQTYDRGWAHRDHCEILATMKKRFGEQIDVNDYPHFVVSVNR